MATNPTPPNGNDNGTPRNPAGPRPRATIVVKNNGGSSGKIQPVKPAAPASPNASARQPVPTTGAPGMSGRIPAASPSGRSGVVRAPGQSQRLSAEQLKANRAALGLSESRPSESIRGLDEFAKKAEALAAREEAKRKSGGKMSATEALHVDDTGARWSMWVKLGIAAVVMAVCGLGGVLLYRTAFPPPEARQAFADTQLRMQDLVREAELNVRFDDGEKLTPDAARRRLKEALEKDLKAVVEQIQRDHAAQRQPDPKLTTRRDFIETMLKFRDGWGRPLVFTVEDDAYLVVSAAPNPGKEIPANERARIRSGTSEKTAEKSN